MRQFSLLLFGTFPLENNIADNLPEIPPVSAQRMLQIRLQITTLTVLDLFQGLGHVDIEGGQQSRLGLDSQLLQIFRIKVEILLAQRTHTHQLHLALKDIDKHGQLVEPGLAQKTSPLRDAIVITELATHIQIIVFVDVGLQILGIGIHRPELVDVELLTVLAHTLLLEQHRTPHLNANEDGHNKHHE